jgi:hypothetical protein
MAASTASTAVPPAFRILIAILAALATRKLVQAIIRLDKTTTRDILITSAKVDVLICSAMIACTSMNEDGRDFGRVLVL